MANYTISFLKQLSPIFLSKILEMLYAQLCIRPVLALARESIVCWYPGYQPMSNLAANYGWAEGTASQNLRIITGWANGTVSQQGIVNSQSMAELTISATIKKNRQVIQNP